MSKKLEYYKYVFIVLTYRNVEDVRGFLKSLENCTESYKTIIVNSFFDEKCKNEIEKVALQYECYFVNVPNKGYGAGNNFGIELARKKYKFDYLVISNPDIVIKKIVIPRQTEKAIFCGKILNLHGKKQNPMLVLENKVSEVLIYKGMKKDYKLLLYLGIGINKILRILFNIKISLSSHDFHQIFAAHGSFFVVTEKALDVLIPLFDENIFLFSEEHVLAKKAKRKNIPIYYTKTIECQHKEDGSMQLWDGSINEELKKSVIYCYEKYC